MQIHIFGYGSLLNPVSRAKTFEEKDIIEGVILHGYQRIANAARTCDEYIALNIQENSESEVMGVLVTVPIEHLDELKKREEGYDMVEITHSISVQVAGPVYTFIMQENIDCTGKHIPQSYLETCLGGVHPDHRDRWLSETIIEYPTIDDREKPLCQNYIPLK